MEKLDDYLRIKEAVEFLGVLLKALRNWGSSGNIVEHRHPLNNYSLCKRARQHFVTQHRSADRESIP
jgi:hypothetical protein